MSTVICGVTAIAAIFLSWLILGTAFVGIGMGIRNVYGRWVIGAEDLFLCFWLGFAVSLISLEVWHCFSKIDGRVLGLVLLLGLAGHAVSRGEAFVAATTTVRGLPARFIVAAGTLTTWVCNRCTASPDFFDSGNYHFPVINWVTTYPIVKGLGNVDGHLGFNNASLLFQGMLETGFWAHRSFHLGNGILLLTLLLFALLQCFECARTRLLSPSLSFFPLTLTVLVFCLVDSGATVAAPGTDFPALGVLFVIAYLLLRSTEIAGQSQGAFRLQVCLILCAIALSIKLSAAIYAFVASACVLVLWLNRDDIPRSSRIRASCVGLVTAGFGVAIWSIRSVILSGYPFFPSLVLPFPVSWRIPAVYAEWYQWWIATFARAPYREYVSGEGWAWIPSWISIELRTAKIEGVLPLLIGAVAILYLCSNRKRGIQLYRRWPMWLPVIVAVVAWFQAAPSFRFGGALLWILAAQAAGVASANLVEQNPRWRKTLLAGVFLLPATAIMARTILNEQIQKAGFVHALATTLWVPPGLDHGMHSVYVADVEDVVTGGGVKAYQPRLRPPYRSERWRDSVMWYGPLPGAQRLKAELAYLAGPGPEQGFRIDADRDSWIKRHAAEVEIKRKIMNIRQLAFYFQVAPRTIRKCLKIN